ncbi:hypothetical protein QNA23_10740 [Rhodococcus erythropolis]|uniref:hypothetical protein n=1 Tax=Rhodococcus erythropolis TaxID=1833 RepID=UPI0024BAEC44|nr:hypothetical protein [Rhodococcus erythropolis]MDJ0403959.1 hypothetical protein [Rhodococcus erythropolis]
MSAPGTYRYKSGGASVTGEIWSMGPLPKTLWVLGADGPVVVNVETHCEVKYAIPTYNARSHMWTSPGGYYARGIQQHPIDARKRNNPVGVQKWAALTAPARMPEPILELRMPCNWELTLDLTSVGCPIAA